MTHVVRPPGDSRVHHCLHATHADAIRCAVLARDAAPGNCRRCGSALAAHVTAAIGLNGIDVLARCSGAVLFEREVAA